MNLFDCRDDRQSQCRDYLSSVRGIFFVGFLCMVVKPNSWFYEITSKGTTIVRSE